MPIIPGNPATGGGGGGGSPTGPASGQLAGTYPGPTLVNSAVIGKVLTGYVSGAGTVAATDTILQAIQKLNGNDLLKLPLAGGTLTGQLVNTRSGNSSGNATILLNPTTGTNATLYGLNNTGGGGYFGLETSVGGTLATGSTAYASIVGSNGATPLHFITNNIVRGTVSSVGALSWVGGAVTTTGTVNGATATEMSYLSGVTSNIQTQLNSFSKAYLFGSGQSGNVNVTGSISLSGPVYYDTLSFGASGSIDVNGWPIFCKTLDLSGAPANAITANGNNGNSVNLGTGGSGGAARTGVIVGGSLGGGSGGGGATGAGTQGAVGNSASPSNGGSSGAGGAGGSGNAGANAGGVLRTGNAALASNLLLHHTTNLLRGVSLIVGGSGAPGGSGGGGDGTNVGGGGGGGGSGAGVVCIYADNIITNGSTAAGAISAIGGNGGSHTGTRSGNAGSGGGGGGGGGGFVYLVLETKVGAAVTDLISASGGTGGNGGNGAGTGLGGNGGNGGSSGNIVVINVATNTGVNTSGTAGSAGTAASGVTGGTGGAGGVCTVTL